MTSLTVKFRFFSLFLAMGLLMACASKTDKKVEHYELEAEARSFR